MLITGIPSSVYLQVLESLTAELEAKTAALSDAEMRFAELEALMHRIVMRSAGNGKSAAGLATAQPL